MEKLNPLPQGLKRPFFTALGGVAEATPYPKSFMKMLLAKNEHTQGGCSLNGGI